MEVCLLQNKLYVFFALLREAKASANLVMLHTCFIPAFPCLEQTKNKPALQVKAIWAMESWKELDVKGLGTIY